MIRPQAEFIHLKRFQEKFKTDENTIFAWDNVIYCNQDLPNDLKIHERTHHEQQHRDGLDFWLENYLNSPEYRLKCEKEAYIQQLRSISDREVRNKIKIQSAKQLASPLYGNLLDYATAFKLLKV